MVRERVNESYIFFIIHRIFHASKLYSLQRRFTEERLTPKKAAILF